MVQVLSIGIAVLDEVFAIPVRIVPGEKHRAGRIDSVIGGNAANASLAIARLGGSVSLIARLGDDRTGATIRVAIEASGIDTRLSRVFAGCNSSRSAIIIEPNGDRSIFNYIDPRLPEAPDWLPASLPVTVGAVLGDTRWEAGARQLFMLARKAGIPAVFDGDRMPANRELIDLATHTAFSAQGLAEMTGTRNLAEGLRRAAQARSNFLAVTDGSNGVFALENGAIRHYPAFPVKAVDTLGAGDVWHGAFTLALAEGMAVDAAIPFASAAAAIKCTRPGGGSGAPDRREVDNFLAAMADKGSLQHEDP